MKLYKGKEIISRINMKMLRKWLRHRTKRGVNRPQEIMSGVPQGCVLPPILFAGHVNSKAEGTDSYRNCFVDDARILRTVITEKDCVTLL